MCQSKKDELLAFDSHTHLDMLKEKGIDPAVAVAHAFDSGVAGMLAISTPLDADGCELTRHFAQSDSRIWMSTGVHPHRAREASVERLDRMRRLLAHPKCVALGEIGLDYHYNHSTPKEQRRAFVAQMKLAHTCELPVIIHTREAEADTLAILKDEGVSQLGGVIHCFSAGLDLAEEAVAMGMYVSFSGIVTFPSATGPAAAVSAVPADRILVETDAPFLSPVPYRGQVNAPARVVTVARKVAALRQVEPAELGAAVVDNARRCFRLEMASAS